MDHESTSNISGYISQDIKQKRMIDYYFNSIDVINYFLEYLFNSVEVINYFSVIYP